MDTLKIITNYHWRKFVNRSDVPKDVLADKFGYQDKNKCLGDFFKYLGCWYHLNNFMGIDDNSASWFDKKWNAYRIESDVSGMLILLSDDCEEFQIATYLKV